MSLHNESINRTPQYQIHCYQDQYYVLIDQNEFDYDIEVGRYTHHIFSTVERAVKFISDCLITGVELIEGNQ